MKNFYITLLLISGLFLAISCGARKSETTKKDETTKTDLSGFFRNSGNSQEFLKTDLNLQTNYSNTYADLGKINSYEFTFEPDDKTKPGVYIDPSGQKHTVENGKLTSKKTTEDKNVKSDSTQKYEESIKSELEKKSNYIQRLEFQIKEIKRLSDKNKKIEREEFSSWNFLLLLLPFGLMYVAWITYKKLNPLS